METDDFEAQAGSRFRMKTRNLSADGWVDAEVLELDPPRRMVWAWSVAGAIPPTTVTFDLSPLGDSTRLRLTHVGEIDPDIGDRLRNGWPGRIEALSAAATSTTATTRSDDE